MKSNKTASILTPQTAIINFKNYFATNSGVLKIKLNQKHLFTWSRVVVFGVRIQSDLARQTLSTEAAILIQFSSEETAKQHFMSPTKSDSHIVNLKL